MLERTVEPERVVNVAHFEEAVLAAVGAASTISTPQVRRCCITWWLVCTKAGWR
jgi:hypothetical protein